MSRGWVARSIRTFRGVSFHFITGSRAAVYEVMQTAEAAGGAVVKAPAAAEWAGYFGYFSDPDGYLWRSPPPPDRRQRHASRR